MNAVRNRVFRGLAAAALFCCFTAPAHAWGRTGHRIVAVIAEDHLTPAARANVKALLGRDSMADIASFGDDYRSEHPETAPWHYVDIPLTEKSYNRDRDCPAPMVDGQPDLTAKWRDCAVDRILYFTAMLKNRDTLKPQKVFALKMLVHLVGDIHQPLHAIGDARGGNSIQVMLFGTKQCGERYSCNLHGTWDEGLIEHKHVNEAKYIAGLEREITDLKLDEKPDGTPIAWANASHRAAIGAWVENGAVINQTYFEDEIPVVDRELEFGGLHLAHLLNSIFTVGPDGTTGTPAGVEPSVVAPKSGDKPKLIPRGADVPAPPATVPPTDAAPALAPEPPK